MIAGGVLSNLPKPRAVRRRPPRTEVEPVALDLIRRYGADIMATARRYSQTREDAEDAYQRGLEILLTKAPSTSEDDLVPWLKTVVKHEAFSLRRQRERGGTPTDAASDEPAHAHDTHERVERLERLQHAAEALGRLKPHEIRCMLLLAEGHSYKQIQEITGFSYTKVNRCLSEGRRSFLERVERIESGAECDRLAPLLSALADGEASARDMAILRPHLRSCLSCRAALRDARGVPARVAALAPVGMLPCSDHAQASVASFGAVVRSGWDWLHERVVGLALRGQDAIEAATAHKVAAAAASAAALGGGGIATIEVAGSHGQRPRHEGRLVAEHRPVARPDLPAAGAVAPRPHHRRRPKRRAPTKPSAKRAVLAPPEPAPRKVAAAAPAARAASTASRPRRAPRSEPQTGEFGP
jgi:RNA polymerase sigma factor (sigma-70 family)